MCENRNDGDEGCAENQLASMNRYLCGIKTQSVLQKQFFPMLFFSRSRDLFIAGIVIIIVTAWFSVGYHHPDEHFQVWEFAKYKLGESPLGDLPWEYHARMRPGMQPLLAYGMVLISRWVGIEDPFVQVFIMRLLVGLAAFWVYWCWVGRLSGAMRDGGRMLRLGLVFFWMMPYLNVRFSSENMSAVTFLGGLLLIFPKVEQKSGTILFFAGLLLGLSFFFRYQIAFAGIGLGAWLLLRGQLRGRHWVLLLLGALVATVLGLLSDYWLYGEWVLAPYHYFTQNIVENKAAGFGTSPWWWYFTEMPVLMLPPLSLFLFWFMGVGIRRHSGHVLVWCLVFFVLGHVLVGHKESRFLFPFLFPMFCLAAMGWDDYVGRGHRLPEWLRRVLYGSLVLNGICLVLRSIYPANDIMVFTRYMRSYSVEHPGTRVYWERKGDPMKEGLVLNFYQRPWMEVVLKDSLVGINDSGPSGPRAGDLVLFKTRQSEIALGGQRMEEAFRLYPDWLLRNDWNGWQGRTRIWSVYRVR
jgi:hypothetical protein